MSDDEIDIEVLRERNIREKNEFLASVFNDEAFTKAVENLRSIKIKDRRTSGRASDGMPKQKNRSKRDTLFRFTGAVPLERRKSARLQNQIPDYTAYDLPNENSNKRGPRDDDSYDDLEKVVFRVKKRRSVNVRHFPARVLPVEAVTDAMIANINRGGQKTYSVDGSSCHQCRQKTLDTKTVCRSGFCFGVRGQFCGICVINRYGEDPAEALKDPGWKCYVCREICNCSFCRKKEGKRPTGILTPIAVQNGFKSVREFLASLKGYGDYSEPEKDPENLLGFTENKAVMGGNKKHNFRCPICRDFKEKVKPKLRSKKLLGFQGDTAVMTQGVKV